MTTARIIREYGERRALLLMTRLTVLENADTLFDVSSRGRPKGDTNLLEIVTNSLPLSIDRPVSAGV